MYLSLLGTQGVPAGRFKEWAELPDFEIINQLISRSWIRKEPGQRISLHPMVREAVQAEEQPTIEKCESLLKKIADFCYNAWLRPYQDNVAVADNVLAVLEYFEELDGNYFRVFSDYCSFLWQVSKFDQSILHCHRLYESCVRCFGINSMETGMVAKLLAGCYMNSYKRQESIQWYKQGLNCMLGSGATECEDLAMSYEKVGRCYTWEYERDLDKAEELLLTSLKMRQNLLARMERGEGVGGTLENTSYTSSLAHDHISSVYRELGKLYFLKKEYEKSKAYALMQVQLLQKYRPENVSSIALGYYDVGVCLFRLAQECFECSNEEEATELLLEAERYVLKSMEINKKMRGTKTLATINNQELLADVYVAQKRYAEASNGYMAVLTMLEKLFGPDHPRINLVKDKMKF